MARPRKQQETLPQNNIPYDLLHSKEFKALKKEVGAAAAVEFFERGSHDLKSSMATCILQKRQIVEETKQKDSYKRAAADIDSFRGAMRDAQKPLNKKLAAAAAIVEYRKHSDKDTRASDLEKAADKLLKSLGPDGSLTVTNIDGSSVTVAGAAQ